MVFYLKVNREERYTYRNLQHWIDTLACMDTPEIFIVSDKAGLTAEIKNCVNFKGLRVSFIESRKTEDIRYVVEHSCVENWWNAGYAHLTTFSHASELGVKEFWNIDADDTCMCVSPERCCEILQQVQLYAKAHQIRCFSLDMWRTVVKRLDNTDHWTFGVTYTDNSIDWWTLMKEHACDTAIWKLRLIKNLDCFFTYLAMKTDASIETYYIDNLKFIHYSDDFFKRPHCSGMFHYRNNQILFPIIYYGFGAKKRGLLDIAEDVIKIDMQITNQETYEFMNEFAIDTLTCEEEFE